MGDKQTFKINAVAPARPLHNDSNFLLQWLSVPGAMVVQNDIVYNIKQQKPINFA